MSVETDFSAPSASGQDIELTPKQKLVIAVGAAALGATVLYTREDQLNFEGLITASGLAIGGSVAAVGLLGKEVRDKFLNNSQEATTVFSSHQEADSQDQKR